MVLYRGSDNTVQPSKPKDPGVAQLVARVVWDHQAAGSNPVTRTKFLGKTALSGGFFAYRSDFERYPKLIYPIWDKKNLMAAGKVLLP